MIRIQKKRKKRKNEDFDFEEVQQAIINQYKVIIILCLHLISLEEIIRI